MRMHVHTYFRPEFAIKQGLADAGDIQITLEASAIAALNEEQREILSEYSHETDSHHHNRPGTLAVATPGWQGVVDALTATFEARLDNLALAARQDADAKLRIEAEIVEYLATEPEYYHCGCHEYAVQPRSPYGNDSDPRVAARLATQKAEIARLEAEHRRAFEIEQEAKAAAKKARQDALRAAVCSGAIATWTNVERAAGEGRDVDGAIAQLVDASLLQTLESIVSRGEPGAVVTKSAYTCEERTDVPTPAAYTVLDTLRAGKSELEGCLGAKEGAQAVTLQIEIGEISRFDVDPRSGHKALRTGVRVSAKTPLLDMEFELFVLAEPLDLDIDESNEDDED